MLNITVITLLFLFAVFDLHVGVSNDAVNFLNSAVGSRAARFKTVLLIAAAGVLIGASTSNGMMDVARHGVFHPQYFTYTELMCIMLGMMTTDVVLLDVFNTLGLPTSTTISLVFELLGGSTALAIYKTWGDAGMHATQLLNTDHALTMILAIFVSVAIAFVVGTVVQWLCRLAFSFNYKKRMRYLSGPFGGLAITAIVYFMVIKNLKGSPLLSPEVNLWLDSHTVSVMLACFAVATALSWLFYAVGINVLRVIVLLGTFALAWAFASNDLVNFIGVPLAGLSAYQDFSANAAGASPDAYLMGALQSSAHTPVGFLVAAGVVMIYSLMTSKKARRVVKTSVDLARQGGGDEMFGASTVARTLVRASQQTAQWIVNKVPERVRRGIDRQFNVDEALLPDGAAFDLLRAAVNLVLSALLIAWGTSYKLPLSTTYVTFMVAMGTSLADRAWGRESAVFRVTGVISVIGGWFLTAGVAFAAAFGVVSLMYFGRLPMMLLLSALAVLCLLHSARRFKKQKMQKPVDELFGRFMTSRSPAEVWRLVKRHSAGAVGEQLDELARLYEQATGAFFHENLRLLHRSSREVGRLLENQKRTRRRELLGLRRADASQAVLGGTYFHILNNSVEGMIYGEKRLFEVLCDHLEKNYNPLPREFRDEFLPLHDEWLELLARINEYLLNHDFSEYHREMEYIDAFRLELNKLLHVHIRRVQTLKDSEMLNAYTVYMSLLQETQAEAAMLKQVVRNDVKFQES